MSPLHDMRRRPVRSALTAIGIAIGVAALVLLGALSEKLSRLVEGGRDFATGQITVSGAGSGALSGMNRGGLLSREQLAAMAAVPGVTFVAPIVMFPVSDAPAALPFTLTPLVFGVDVAALARNRRGPPPDRDDRGRLLGGERGSRGGGRSSPPAGRSGFRHLACGRREAARPRARLPEQRDGRERARRAPDRLARSREHDVHGGRRAPA